MLAMLIRWFSSEMTPQTATRRALRVPVDGCPRTVWRFWLVSDTEIAPRVTSARRRLPPRGVVVLLVSDTEIAANGHAPRVTSARRRLPPRGVVVLVGL